MASAMSNAQARDELRGLAERQGAALRRVATLVARQAPPSTIFNAVAGEASRALRVARVVVARVDDGWVTVLGSTGSPVLSASDLFSSGRYDADTETFTKIYGTHGDRSAVPDGNRVRVIDCPDGAMVLETGRPGRRLDLGSGAGGGQALRLGYGPSVAAPIVVDGAIWGFIGVLRRDRQGSPAGCETRLADFTHLAASSISNAHARNSLIASRARIVSTSDETRRQIERNLHDGIQQRIVGRGPWPARGPDRAPVAARSPGRTGRGGPRPGERARGDPGLLPGPASRAAGPIGPWTVVAGAGAAGRRSRSTSTSPAPCGSPKPIETAVYYVVSEALANAAKHSQASEVSVTVVSGEAVRATICDDGVGGAALGRGSGLIGLVDRVEALGGRFTLESPAGRGTTISIELPLDAPTIGEGPGVFRPPGPAATGRDRAAVEAQRDPGLAGGRWPPAHR